MHIKSVYSVFIFICLINLLGCAVNPEPSIINRHAEALLTNKNELQFRFKINEKVFTKEKMYKVKVLIHDEQLAVALGGEEFIYGAKEVFNGKSLNVSDSKQSFIYMEPIPLLLDLHVFDIQKIITDQKAISIEIISDEEVIAKSYLTNFTSQM